MLAAARVALPLLCASLVACQAKPREPVAPRQIFEQHVSAKLLRDANHGRDVFRPDGMLKLPPRVKVVHIDVGAHMLETTSWVLEQTGDRPTIGLIAIEPQEQCWAKWPDRARLISLPVAIFTERGTMDFHVNAADVTSSLATSKTGTELDAQLTTVEVRKVPVLRLEDVLAAIPPEIEIDYLKSDVQGADLQVLQSAGEQLRRVRRVKVEVVNAPYYTDVPGHKAGTEAEIVEYMEKTGFLFAGDCNVAPSRSQVDKLFVNLEKASAARRAR